MIVLIKFFNADLYGVVGTTVVLTWLINFVFNPIYSSKCLGVKIITFYPCLLRSVLSAAILTGAFYLISMVYYPSSWAGLVLVAFCCGVLGIIMHFLIVLNPKDWKKIFNVLKKEKTNG